MKRRGSEFPLLDICAASAHSKVSINTTSEAAQDGTEGHALARCHIMGLPHAEPSSDGVRASHEWFKWAWEQMHIFNAKCEVEVGMAYEGIEYSGHIDILDETIPLIVDIKTGRGEGEYFPQLIEYAACWLNHPPYSGWDGRKIRLAILNTTKQTIQTWELTPSEVWVEFEKIHRKILYWDGQYNVGDHCKYCPARDFCQANLTKINNSLELLGQPGMVGKVDTDRLVEAYPLIGQMESCLKFLKDFVRDQVCLAGGRIETPSGTLELQQINSDKIIVTECAQWLQKTLGQEAFFGILEVGMGKAETALIDKYRDEDVDFVLDNEPELVKTNAKGKVVKCSLDEQKKWLRGKLRSQDAIRTKTHTELNFKPAKKEITGD